MPRQKRFKSEKYAGVYWVMGRRRGNTDKTERIYYITFWDGKKTVEEKVQNGRASEGMTEAKANNYRTGRIEGRVKSAKQKRQEAKEEKEAADNRRTIKKMWDAYIDREDKPIKGIAQDKSRFQKYLEPVIGGKEPTEITELDVQKIANKMKNLSLQTKAHAWRLLRRVIRAEASEEVWKSVAKDTGIVKRMPGKIHNEVDNIFTDEMLARYLAAVEADHDPVVRAVIKLAMFTGMRRGEILGLQWKNIDLRAGFVLLPDPKSGRPERIPLSPHAVEVVKEVERGESDLLFPGRSGKPRHDIKRGLKRVKERAGLPEGYRPLHDLRHNYATRLASSGKVDLYMLQKLLCHKDPATTMRYAHLIDRARKDAAALAGDLFTQAIENGKTSLDDEMEGAEG